MIQTEGTTGTNTVVEYSKNNVCALRTSQASVAAIVLLGVFIVKTKVTVILIQKIRRINND